MPASPGGPRTRSLPPAVWALGVVSLLMDSSSELIHGLLPAFLVGVLGASTVQLGLVEGVAEMTASVVRLFSGAVSDLLGRRKAVVVTGYGLAALTKPLFAMADGVGTVLAARFVDRIGKGIRAAPRDALIADVTPEALRGRAYGLRQALDSLGAVLGPLLAIGLMVLLAGDIRRVLWFAVVPAVAAVAVLVLFVHEPARGVPRTGEPRRFALHELERLPGRFWLVVAIATVATLARFSEAFLILRLSGLGLGASMAPLALLVMSLVYTLSAYPAGWAADRFDRRRLLIPGLAILVVADLVLAGAGSITAGLIGVAIWGLYMGTSQGLMQTLVAEAAPAPLRGTAFGLYHLVTGLGLLAASLLAGWLWSRYSPAAPFLFGAACASVTLLALVAMERAKPSRPGRPDGDSRDQAVAPTDADGAA